MALHSISMNCASIELFLKTFSLTACFICSRFFTGSMVHIQNGQSLPGDQVKPEYDGLLDDPVTFD